MLRHASDSIVGNRDNSAAEIEPTLGLEALTSRDSGFPIERWLAEGSATIVKQGAHRSVYRLDLPQGAFYLKREHHHDLSAKLRRFVRHSASRREWTKSRELSRRKIPTIEALRFIETKRFGLIQESFLLTKAIPDSSSLYEYVTRRLPELSPGQQRRVRSMLVERMALLMAAAHSAGVYHDDVHLGNILVSAPVLASDGKFDPHAFELFLIDIPGVQLSRPLKWNTSCRNLAVLRACSARIATQRDYLRFWRVYTRSRPELAGLDEAEVWREIEEYGICHERQLHNSRDKRAFKNNRHFHKIGNSNFRGHAVAELEQADCARLLANPDLPLADNWHRPVRLKQHNFLVEASITFSNRVVPVAYRICHPGGWRERIAAAVGRGAGRRLWRIGHALQSRRIPAPRPLFLLENKRGANRGQWYLATAWLERAESLDALAQRIGAMAPASRRRILRQCAISLGMLIGRLHRWRLAHRDLNGTSLVAVVHLDRVETYLVDWKDVRWPRLFFGREAIRNIARLADALAGHSLIGRADRLRFLQAYLRQVQVPPQRWKLYWRAIEKRSATSGGRS